VADGMTELDVPPDRTPARPVDDRQTSFVY
jgi:hypothetical protein